MNSIVIINKQTYNTESVSIAMVIFHWIFLCVQNSICAVICNYLMNVCYLSTDHTKQQGSKWKPQSGWHNYSDRWGQHWGHDPSGGPKQDKGSHHQTQPHHAEVNLNTTRTFLSFLCFWLLFNYFISSKLNPLLVFPSDDFPLCFSKRASAMHLIYFGSRQVWQANKVVYN